jgi:hypothetical protein
MKQRLPWGGLSADSVEKADLVVMGIPFDGAVSAGRGAAACFLFGRGFYFPVSLLG